MAAPKKPALQVETFTDYQIITQPNPLQQVIRRVDERDKDDPVGRAEKALAGLSGEFKSWMAAECERLSTAHAALIKDDYSSPARDELFRAAHDVKGDAATFGYPAAAHVAQSLCRLIEHSPDMAHVPGDLLVHHVNAIHAIYRDQSELSAITASELSKRLRGLADAYLIQANRDRPEHLEAVISPGLVPAD
jgi:HPt (histidine-containing phosphotransfer) domain-containing protein